jgi:two-component sensor histidine kinase
VLVRTRAIAHVQAILTGKHSDNGFADYISRLCNQLFAISDAPGQIEIHAEKVPVEIDQFVPAALVTSELVTNSLKHVLSRGHGRTITVRILPKSPETTILSVADDGRDFPPVLQKGSGLNLVEALTAAMGGAVTFGPSSNVVVMVPNRRPTERLAP